MEAAFIREIRQADGADRAGVRFAFDGGFGQVGNAEAERDRFFDGLGTAKAHYFFRRDAELCEQLVGNIARTGTGLADDPRLRFQ